MKISYYRIIATILIQLKHTVTYNNATRKHVKVYYEVVSLTFVHVFCDCLKGFSHPVLH